MEDLLRHLVEFQFGAWLEEWSYTVIDLEALREGSSDIEAISPGGIRSAFEIKFIGSQDVDFEMQLKSLAKKPSWYPISPYAAINYLTFRVYEAVKRLQRASINKIAIVIIDEVAWWRFDLQLKNGWIDWTDAQFVGMDETEKTFIIRQQTNYPGLSTDLAETIRTIDSIWIVANVWMHAQ